MIQVFEQQESNTTAALWKLENIDEQEGVSKRARGRAYYDLAKLFYDKSDIDKAEANFIKSLEFSELPQDAFAVLKVYGFLIRIASEKLDDALATQHISAAEDLINELPKVLGSLNSEYFYNLGLINKYKGDFKEANNNFLLGIKMSKEENDPEIQSKCLHAIASSCYLAENYPTALTYLKQLDELLRIIDKSYLLGSMYMLYAQTYYKLEKFPQALEYYTSANTILHQKKCWNLQGYILLGKGNIYKSMGEYDKSLVFYELARESVDARLFKRLTEKTNEEITEVNDTNVDIYLDRTNRKVKEKILGTINFKHRFVLLEILFLLAQRKGEYFDKEGLAKAVWKDEYNPLIHDKLIYTSVSRLRKLIEPKNKKGEKRKYIIRGKDGYAFNPHAKIRFHMENKSGADSSIANIEISSPV